MNARTRRLLSTSATRTLHEHNHATARIPGSCLSMLRAQLALDWEADLRMGGEPHPPHRPPTPGGSRTPRGAAPCGTNHTPPPSAGRGFTGQGPTSFRHRRLAPSSLANESRWRSFTPTRSTRTPRVAKLREHRPELPMLNDAARPKPNQVSPTIPPTGPAPTNQRENVGPVWPPPSRFREDGKPNDNAPIRSRRPRLPARHGTHRTVCTARRPPGPRAASPDSPRRDPRSAAPEVPSTDEPPSRTHSAFALRAPSGEVFPQVVANLWKYIAPSLASLSTRRP